MLSFEGSPLACTLTLYSAKAIIVPHRIIWISWSLAVDGYGDEGTGRGRSQM